MGDGTVCRSVDGTVAAEPSRIDAPTRDAVNPTSFNIAYAALPYSFDIRTAGEAALTSMAPWRLVSGRHSAMIAHRAICCVSLRCSYKNQAQSRADLVGRANAPGNNLIYLG
eukprot:6212536-Pleurochrysis_carterae.AAC.1